MSLTKTFLLEYKHDPWKKKIPSVTVEVWSHSLWQKRIIWVKWKEPNLDEHLWRRIERILSEWDTCSTCLQSDGVDMSCLHPLNLKDGKAPTLPNPETVPDFVCPNHVDFQEKAAAFLKQYPDFLEQFAKPEEGYFPLLEELRRQAALETFQDTMRWAFWHWKGWLMVM